MTRTLSILGGCALLFFCPAARAADGTTSDAAPAKEANGGSSPEAAPSGRARAAVDVQTSMDLVGPSYRSPGLAVALSLTPIPVDFGNLYAENIPWGIAYTSVEAVLMAPMMWMFGAHMHDGSGDGSWSTAERGWEIGLVSGYVLVKIAAGIHAGYAAANFNAAHEQHPAARLLPIVAPTPGGALFSAVASF